MPEPVMRTQADGAEDDKFYGDLAATVFNDESLTRQEFAKDADPNYIIAKHGINPFARPQPFGEVDFTMDLQQAISAVANAKRWHAKMPATFHDEFPSWVDVLRAANDGTLAAALEQLSKPPGTPPDPNAAPAAPAPQ